jgi:hypothetical protein
MAFSSGKGSSNPYSGGRTPSLLILFGCGYAALGLASKQLDGFFEFCFIALMQDADAIERMKSKFRALGPLLDERLRRQWAATEATAYGWGGVEAISRATGLSPNTIRKGQRELAAQQKNLGLLPIFWST